MRNITEVLAAKWATKAALEHMKRKQPQTDNVLRKRDTKRVEVLESKLTQLEQSIIDWRL